MFVSQNAVLMKKKLVYPLQGFSYISKYLFKIKHRKIERMGVLFSLPFYFSMLIYATANF